jgi:hypothetical protein
MCQQIWSSCRPPIGLKTNWISSCRVVAKHAHEGEILDASFHGESTGEWPREYTVVQARLSTPLRSVMIAEVSEETSYFVKDTERHLGSAKMANI